MKRELIIIGVGGAGLEALMVARRMTQSAWTVLGFADDAARTWGSVVDGFRVLGGVDATLSAHAGKEVWFHCAIGRNPVRQRIALTAEARGFRPASLIDPSAVVAESATIGAGSYVAAHVFVGPQARVGRHALINVGSSVGHDAVVGDFAQVCPGARLSGNVAFGELAFIGTNGVVAPGVQIGRAATVGAASFAHRDVPAAATAIGVPAKVLAVPLPSS